MQRIVVWGMKCISYDYDFESNLATQWKELDRRRRQVSVSVVVSSSEEWSDEDEEDLYYGSDMEDISE